MSLVQTRDAWLYLRSPRKLRSLRLWTFFSCFRDVFVEGKSLTRSRATSCDSDSFLLLMSEDFVARCDGVFFLSCLENDHSVVISGTVYDSCVRHICAFLNVSYYGVKLFSLFSRPPWSMQEFLEIVGLPQYIVSFKRNGVESVCDVLMLGDEDLDALTVKPLHRKKMRRIIEEAMKVVEGKVTGVAEMEVAEELKEDEDVSEEELKEEAPKAGIVFSDEEEEGETSPTEAAPNESAEQKKVRELERVRKASAKNAKNLEKQERRTARLAEDEKRRQEIEALRKVEEEQKVGNNVEMICFQI
jgi:hypothetical protein